MLFVIKELPIFCLIVRAWLTCTSETIQGKAVNFMAMSFTKFKLCILVNSFFVNINVHYIKEKSKCCIVHSPSSNKGKICFSPHGGTGYLKMQV